MQTYLHILLAFLLLQTANAVGNKDFDSRIGCQITNKQDLVSGLKGSVYYYPWLRYNTTNNNGNADETTYETEPYLSKGYYGDRSIIDPVHSDYLKAGIVANDVTATQLTYSFNNLCAPDGNCFGEIWENLDYFKNKDGSPLKVPIENFAFHMSGYLIPNVTGKHLLNITYVDDLAIVNIASNGFKTQNCCDNFSPTGDVSGNNTIQSKWTANGPSGINQANLDLVAGVAYPIDFFYVNRGGLGGINFEYTDPNGVKHSTLDGFVYHLSSNTVCDYIEKHVVTMQWDQSTSSQSSTVTSDFLTETNTYLGNSTITYTGTVIQETEIFYVPIPTITTLWTGSSTSTTTSYSTTTDTDGNPVTRSTVIIQTPNSSNVAPGVVPGSTITKTTPWTGVGTSTTTTNLVSTGNDGKVTTVTIVIVETPQVITTTTTPWTGVDVVTTTTETVSTGDDGNPTTVTIVIIETPGSTITNKTPEHITTTTTPWTGVDVTSSTTIATVTGTDGNPTTSTVVIVKIPGSVATTTSPWTGTGTSTTTSISVSTGTDGKLTISTVVIIVTPYDNSTTSNAVTTAKSTITTTSVWTGKVTSTTTSEVVSTGTDGKPTTSTIVIIVTPTRMISTTTIPWTGTVTETTNSDAISTGTDGKPTTSAIVIIKTPASTITTNYKVSTTTAVTSPKSTLTTTAPWTGTRTETSTFETVSTGTDGKPTTSTIVIVQTPRSTVSTTTPWTGTFTTTFTTETFVTGLDNSTTTVTVVIVETPTFTGWNSTALQSSSGIQTTKLQSSSIDTPSTFVTTATSTNVKTVVCTKSVCSEQSQVSSSASISNQVSSSVNDPTPSLGSAHNPTQSTIKTSYLTSLSESKGNVANSVTISGSPAIVTSVQESFIPLVMTTDNANKASNLAISGFVILLLQLI